MGWNIGCYVRFEITYEEKILNKKLSSEPWSQVPCTVCLDDVLHILNLRNFHSHIKMFCTDELIYLNEVAVIHNRKWKCDSDMHNSMGVIGLKSCNFSVDFLEKSWQKSGNFESSNLYELSILTLKAICASLYYCNEQYTQLMPVRVELLVLLDCWRVWCSPHPLPKPPPITSPVFEVNVKVL